MEVSSHEVSIAMVLSIIYLLNNNKFYILRFAQNDKGKMCRFFITAQVHLTALQKMCQFFCFY